MFKKILLTTTLAMVTLPALSTPHSQMYQQLIGMDTMLNQSISENKNQIIDNRMDIENLYETKMDKIDLDNKLDTNIFEQYKTNTDNRIEATQSDINRLDGRINSLNDKIEGGLATVTALTSLHPNPRYKGKTQISIGSGMYADNVAGAVGVFHWVNDRVMLNVGAAYGGDSQWAGSCGISIGL